MNLKKKLIEIRKAIGILQKDQKGNGFTSINAPLMILKARNKMDELGVLLFSKVIKHSLTRENAPIKSNKDQMDFVVSIDLMMIFADSDSHETIEIPWFAYGSHMKDPAMAGGGALTYYEKYFLMKQFNIPTPKDDPDILKSEAKGATQITSKQVNQINDLMLIKIADKADFFRYLKVDSVEDIQEKKFSEVVNMLNGMISL
ncbi:MAG: hypothetical protein GY793_06600 [Proteobacteria bacterium]|nr:hypothetical protein [Pseudomonadota bacterium]